MPDVGVGQTIYPSYDAGATGLTPGIQITNKVTGATLLARTTSGVAEQPSGSGSYDYTTGFSVPDVPSFKVSWNNTVGAVVATEDYNVVSTVDTVVSLLSGTVTVTTPVDSSGDVSIVHGDDYSNTDSRALTWTTDDAATWPTLTSATITFTAQVKDTTLTTSGSVVQATGANKSVRVELTAAQTTSLRVGRGSFDIQATLTSGRKVTLQRGTFNVLQDYSA